MDRRDFMKGASLAGALSLLPLADRALAGEEGSRPATESGQAYADLARTLQEVEAGYLNAQRGITRPGDVSDGHRFLLHVLQTGLFLRFEYDPERPSFRRIISPTRKLLGDQPDAVYFEAPIRGDRRYRIRGNTAGAVYTSFTIEAGGEEGGYPERTEGAINDSEFAIAKDGSYELLLGPDVSGPNTVKLPADARTVTTRSYFETLRPVAADQLKVVPIAIAPVEDPGPAPSPDDASIARSIRRVISYVRGTTVDQPLRAAENQPSWVSLIPNRFNAPAKPAGMAFAAPDNAYASAPYVLRPDQALVMEGRFPTCRFSSVMLWNRFLQSYDYGSRQISLNRAQTKLDSEGRYRIVIAGRDPGVPNWIDTEGRPSGLVYWRFLLPEGDIETPRARVVPLSELRG
ncbi:MAG: twin-arginine translocation signal domain-containing protein [bacterium]|nr:hypothetical protein [Deltaproteobacteria bacterium]MCP4908010.1 twin-arginine translocation signal domain-containing protein [bacterium]